MLLYVLNTVTSFGRHIENPKQTSRDISLQKWSKSNCNASALTCRSRRNVLQNLERVEEEFWQQGSELDLRPLFAPTSDSTTIFPHPFKPFSLDSDTHVQSLDFASSTAQHRVSRSHSNFLDSAVTAIQQQRSTVNYRLPQPFKLGANKISLDKVQ